MHHGVLVQPSVYGYDNSCLIDALHHAKGRLRGIAVPSPGSTADDLTRMHDAGVRGIRCNLVNSFGLTPSHLAPWRSLLRDLHWHVEVQLRLRDLPEALEALAPYKIPIVVDHMGRPDPLPDAVACDNAAAAVLMYGLTDALRRGDCYVKLSAPYRITKASAPWRRVTAIARALIEAAPGRCLWGSDWPHTEMTVPVDTFACQQAIFDCAGFSQHAETILKQTPLHLYC